MNKKYKFLCNVLLGLLGIITVIPFVWMFLSSFKHNTEIVSLSQSFFPKEFTFDNYVGIQDNFDFIRLFMNSLFVALAVTGLVIYTSTISGFVLSKYQFKGRNLLFGLIMATMMIPWAVTIIPRYSMILKFGWIDSYAALIIPS